MTNTDPVRVLFLGHAAERTGPPIILLDIVRWMKENTDIEMGFVMKETGPLMTDYKRIGPVWVAPDWLDAGPARLARRALWKAGMENLGEQVQKSALGKPLRDVGEWPVVYANSAGTASLLPLLPQQPRRLITHVHELSVGLDFHLPKPVRELITARTDAFITVADAVTDEIVRIGMARPGQVTTIRGCIEPAPAPGPNPPTRESLGIPADAFVVGSAGLLHWRKAPDLFVSLAQRLVTGGANDPWFVWIGGAPTDKAGKAALADVQAAGLGERVRFVPHQENPRDWLRLFDVFALTAREDAFPLVCLEAGSVGCPVVCFTSGGIGEFVRDDAGVVVPYPDLDAMAAAIRGLQDDPDCRARLGATAQARVASDHDVATVAPRIAAVIEAVAHS